MGEKSIRKKPGGEKSRKRATSKNRSRPAGVNKRGFDFEHANEAVIVLDVEGRLASMNATARTLLGGKSSGTLKLEDWPGKFGLYLEDGVTRFPAERLPPWRVLRGESSGTEEMILGGADTGPAQTRVSMSARPLKRGRAVEGVLILMQDVTERKKLEQSREDEARWIETSRRLTRIISESARDVIGMADSVARLAAETLGDMSVFTLLNTNGEKITVAAYHDRVPEVEKLLQEALAAGPDYQNDAGLAATVIQSGKPLLIPSISSEELVSIGAPKFGNFLRQSGIHSLLVVPLTGRRGVNGALLLFRHRTRRPYEAADQTLMMEIAQRTALAMESEILFESMRAEMAERASTKQALHASEERFRSIFELTTLGMKILDSQGTILQVNPAFQNMLGYTEAEMIGRNFCDFLHPDDLERAMTYFNDLKLSGAAESHFEHRTLHKDGSVIWARTTFTVVTKGGGDNSLAFIVGIVENVTPRKHLEAETMELKGRLQNNVELERLRLARDLHDGPMQELYSVIYRIEEIRAQMKPEPSEVLTNINRDIQKVLSDLRATAKELRPPTISNFGLEKALRSEAQDFQDKFPAIQIELSLAQDRQILPEEVRLALFRVFQQSLANIVQHAQATRIRVHFSFDVEEAHLEVQDNGKGFQVPSNWIEFARNGHYGLAGAAERINALGGTLTVESETQKKTIVRAVVPWQDSPASGPSEEGQESITKRARDLI